MNNDVEWLRKFLDICCSSDLHESDEQFQIAIQILVDRYTDGDRHRYSKIAALLKRPPYCDFSSDQFDMLRSNMEYIEERFETLYLSDKVKISSIKLFDHLVLEVDRINNIDRKIEQIQDQQNSIVKTISGLEDGKSDFKQLLGSISRIINQNENAQKQLKEIRKQYDEYDEKLNSARDKLTNATVEIEQTKNRLDGFNTESVTILSIFTAIVFAFTGGFTMLGSAFSNLAGITRNESILLIVVVLIVGCILLDIVYFLLNFIGKMSNIRLSGNCDLNCNNCSKKKDSEQTCNKWTRFVNRHFLLKCINIGVALIVAFLLSVSLFFLTPSFPHETVANHAETSASSEENYQDNDELISNTSDSPCPTITIESQGTDSPMPTATQDTSGND